MICTAGTLYIWQFGLYIEPCKIDSWLLYIQLNTFDSLAYILNIVKLTTGSQLNNIDSLAHVAEPYKIDSSAWTL